MWVESRVGLLEQIHKGGSVAWLPVIYQLSPNPKGSGPITDV